MTPPKEKGTTPQEENGMDNIYFLTAPQGIFRIDMSDVRCDPMHKWYMLDSGAAISVAPYGAFKNV